MPNNTPPTIPSNNNNKNNTNNNNDAANISSSPASSECLARGFGRSNERARHSPLSEKISEHQWAGDGGRRASPALWMLSVRLKEDSEYLPSLRSHLEPSWAFSSLADLILKILMLVMFGNLTRAFSVGSEGALSPFRFCALLYLLLRFLVGF